MAPPLLLQTFILMYHRTRKDTSDRNLDVFAFGLPDLTVTKESDRCHVDLPVTPMPTEILVTLQNLQYKCINFSNYTI